MGVGVRASCKCMNYIIDYNFAINPLTCISSRAWFMIFSGSSKLFRTLLMFDFATLWNRSNRFMDKAVDLYVGDAEWQDGDGSRRVKDDDVEKASAAAKEATRGRAVRKFMVQLVSGYVIVLALLHLPSSCCQFTYVYERMMMNDEKQ